MSSPLAENLARFRKARNLSQEELAAAASVGVDTVGRIERGERRTTRPATVAKLARVLAVTPDALLGLLPAAHAVRDAEIANLRQAITASAEVPGLDELADTDDVSDPAILAKAGHAAWRAYVDGRHGELLHALPVLLADARRLVHVTTGDANAAAQQLLSTAYRLGAGIAGRLDMDDLAWTAAERALIAARESDQPEIDSAISLRYLAWALIKQGRAEEAERVAVKAAERIEPRMLDRDTIRAGVFGNLLFNAAHAALRSGSGDRANDLLAIAQSAALRAGRDTATEAAIFGPRVAAFQAVDHAVRLGDPETALRLADRIAGPRGPVPAFWEAGHRLHLAHAAAQLRRDRSAVGLVSEARELAPDWVQRQPLGTTVMRGLVDRATRRRGRHFAELAAHYGVL
ncbi:helix-turn-helix transcriptional regulator [Amycolatopsis sp. 195334CR]|uniref:helix-turn-helix domain-containing protein n=1 Tax=Amycolatopsis sp. 195334CR TaxID=2814588 RepID=UPI001A8CC227|nr:helix-turn-helix transcriptional regulator [Amycolatopsis sp. 195334CR]MBN6038710.1 helix-turn-helix transcriptional regulator [Amycolatopsis sp. 195334CR]